MTFEADDANALSVTCSDQANPWLESPFEGSKVPASAFGAIENIFNYQRAETNPPIEKYACTTSMPLEFLGHKVPNSIILLCISEKWTPPMTQQNPQALLP